MTTSDCCLARATIFPFGLFRALSRRHLYVSLGSLSLLSLDVGYCAETEWVQQERGEMPGKGDDNNERWSAHR